MPRGGRGQIVAAMLGVLVVISGCATSAARVRELASDADAEGLRRELGAPRAASGGEFSGTFEYLVRNDDLTGVAGDDAVAVVSFVGSRITKLSFRALSAVEEQRLLDDRNRLSADLAEAGSDIGHAGLSSTDRDATEADADNRRIQACDDSARWCEAECKHDYECKRRCRDTRRRCERLP